tara:strand:- start:498 stop:1340 length:843 start_codon:yes stop_codon:yes gene_type:complete
MDIARKNAMEDFYDDLGYTAHDNLGRAVKDTVVVDQEGHHQVPGSDKGAEYVTGGASQHSKDQWTMKRDNQYYMDEGATEYTSPRMDQYNQLVEDIKVGAPGAEDAMNNFLTQNAPGGGEQDQFEQDFANIRVAETGRRGADAAEKQRTSNFEQEVMRRTDVAQELANQKATAEHEAAAAAAAKGKPGSKRYNQSVAEWKSNNPLELPYNVKSSSPGSRSARKGEDRYGAVDDTTYSTGASGNLIDMLGDFGRNVPENTPMEKSGFKMAGSYHYGKKKKV